MSEITLEKTLKEELIVKIQCYMEEELDKTLGSFEAEFLLDFFAAQMGPHFYNQALADVLKGFDQTVNTFTETVYALEKNEG
jgi:uncharacterized protein (DUF2164 family)